MLNWKIPFFCQKRHCSVPVTGRPYSFGRGMSMAKRSCPMRWKGIRQMALQAYSNLCAPPARGAPRTRRCGWSGPAAPPGCRRTPFRTAPPRSAATEVGCRLEHWQTVSVPGASSLRRQCHQQAPMQMYSMHDHAQLHSHNIPVPGSSVPRHMCRNPALDVCITAAMVAACLSVPKVSGHQGCTCGQQARSGIGAGPTCGRRSTAFQ